MRSLAIVVAAAALAVAGSECAISSSAQAAPNTAYAYGWPVPFDRPHPVRGNFGDPRTIFAGPPTERTLLSGPGAFQFHDGIDISAPDGTTVYAVASGTVKSVMRDWIAVERPWSATSCAKRALPRRWAVTSVRP